MNPLVIAITAIVALALGGAIGVLWTRLRASGVTAEAATQHALAKQSLEQATRERDDARNRIREQESTLARHQESITLLTGQAEAARRDAARAGALQADLHALRDELTARTGDVASLTTALDESRAAAERERARLTELHEQLTNEFQALAARALSKNSTDFLQLARENLNAEQAQARGELEKRQQAIDALVEPLKEQLKRYEVQVQALEQSRNVAYGELHQSVKNLDSTQQMLRAETGNLVKALRAPQTRGRWGESTLRTVAELAGMVARCDFVEQATVGGADGNDAMQRPDMIVNLPGGRRVVVDAKTPLAAYLEMVEATTDEARRDALTRHARHIRQHADLLSSKGYWNAYQPGPEYVVLFIPGEQFLSAALEHEPELWESIFRKNVILATPATLIALLRTIELTWRQDELARNAEEVRRAGDELHDRVRKMLEHFAKIGSNLRQSVEAYNSALGSMESRVLPSARRLRTLGAGSGEELKAALAIDQQPREIKAAE